MDNIGNQIFIVHYKHEKKQIWGGDYSIFGGELIFGMV